MEKLKKDIDSQIKNLENGADEKTLRKINKIREFIDERDKKSAEKINKVKKLSSDKKISEKNAEKITNNIIDNHIKKLNKTNKNLNLYQKFFQALEENVDIDPGRLIGLTDGIFGIAMTLLVFGISIPELKITTDANFLTFLYSMIPNIGITLVSFILLASFWVYHHEFLKIKKLNMPYLWLNILFLATISFIPFGTSLVGKYSHFFLANVIFGLNIFLTILFFLLMYHYASSRGFLNKEVSEQEKKYVNHTLYIIMLITIIVNLLDFNVNHNFIYLFLLVPIVSTIRDIIFKLKD